MNLKVILFLSLLAVVHTRLVNRIFGGRPVEPFSFPNTVLVDSIKTERYNETFICGGIIYNENWIVVGGSCARNMGVICPHEHVRIRAGKWNLSETEPFEQIRSIVAKFVHEDFNPVVIGKSVDLGFIKVNESFIFDQYVTSYPFSTNITYPMGFGVVTGWGCKTEEQYCNKKPTDILNFLIAYVSPYDKCKLVIKEQMEKRNREINDDDFDQFHFCTGTFTNVLLGPSFGDSGGPFMQLNSDGKYEVVGVISAGARRPNIALYMHVPHFLDWFEDKVRMYS